MEGTWKKSSNEGFEALFKALDAEDMLSKLGDLETTITINGSEYTIERKRPNITTTNQFNIGEETEMNTIKDGLKPVCIASLDGDKIVIKAKDYDYQNVIEVVDGKLKETFSSKGVSGVRWSEKV